MDQAPEGVRAEDTTPGSGVARSMEPVATFFNLPGLRLPQPLLGDGPGGGFLPRVPRPLARAPRDPRPDASETTTPALLPRPGVARPTGHGSPGDGRRGLPLLLPFERENFLCYV